MNSQVNFIPRSPSSPNATQQRLPSPTQKMAIPPGQSPFATVPQMMRGPAPSHPMASTSMLGADHPEVIRLRQWLANAPRLWTGSPSDPPVQKFRMGDREEIACIWWKGRFYITGTHIVRILMFRFQVVGRQILNPKKFEEDVFSEMRNLKPGVDAELELPRSEFLEFLHKHGCIKTKKKQKVYYWDHVPHEELFKETLDKALKRTASLIHMNQLMNMPEMAGQIMMMQAAAAANRPYMIQQPGPMTVNTFPSMMAAYSSPVMVQPNRGYITQGNPVDAQAAYGNAMAQQMMQQRATNISMSQMPMSPLINNMMGSSQLASTAELDSYFDETTTPVACPTPASLTIHQTINPSLLQEDNSSPPAAMRSQVPNNEDLNEKLMNSLTGMTSSSELRGDITMDPTLSTGLDGEGLSINDLWSMEKFDSNVPLWDDLAGMMPDIAPNIR